MIYLLGKSMVATSGLMILAAFTGSLISMGFVLLISRKVKQMSMLVVSGIMIGYICSAITDFVVTLQMIPILSIFITGHWEVFPEQAGIMFL